MLNIQVRTQTIFLLVGPIKAGKTTFARALKDQLEADNYGYTVELLSSDGLRAEMLKEGSHQHSRRMMEVSAAAFDLLQTKFRIAMDWRVRKDFIIIDTKGFDSAFRDLIRTEGQAAGYQVKLVQFEPDRDAYLSHTVTRETMYNEGRPITDKDLEDMIKSKSKSLSHYRQKVLGQISFKGYDGTERVRRYSDVQNMTIEVTNQNAHLLSRLSNGEFKQFVVIPDLHENIDALENVIDPFIAERESYGFKYTRIYLGDYLDKGNNTARIIERIYNDIKQGTAIVIAGNHENYVYQRLKGRIKDIDRDLEDEFFTSLKVLLKDEELADKFIFIYENWTSPFLRLYDPKDELRTFFFTHSPCRNKYIGSFETQALKQQRNFMFFDREKTKREQLGIIHDEAHFSDPIHVFGHVSHNGFSDCKNKIFLDKGIEENNIAQLMFITQDHYELVELNLHEGVEGYTTTLERDVNKKMKIEKAFDKADYTLTPHEERLLRNCTRNGVRMISGTMAPAPSTDTEIESMKAGLRSFLKAGVTEVMLQPKYMGSRAQMYLFPSGEGHFFVSRNGYRVRDTDEFVALLQSEFEKYKHIFEEGDTEPLIIDGELLPWSALGANLIDETFLGFGGLVNYEIGNLAIDDAYQALEFNAKIDAGMKMEQLEEFYHNVELYGQHTEPHVRAFQVMTYRDRFPDNILEQFIAINGDDCLAMTLSEEGFDEAVKTATEFFKELSIERGMEGVVIKPMVEQEGKIPYMKVRNESYLTLIYGYDYKDKYEKLCQTKNVGSKSNLAIKERTYGNMMLNNPVGSPKWTEGIYKLITTLREEKTLDPRL